LVNKINPPDILHTFGRKPWEVNLYDSMDIWKNVAKFGQTCSLDELCNIFGVKSPKDGIDGSMVGEYFHDGKINEIKEYCEKDILSLKDVIVNMVVNLK
jgi:predicted PolB exonuclease-like 3'-5' exonuclease